MIRTYGFEPAHLTAAPSLHAGATEPQPDMNAMMYSLQRLPAKVMQIRHFVLGQSAIAFERAGYEDFSAWTLQTAPARRRKWHYDGKETLGALIASSWRPPASSACARSTAVEGLTASINDTAALFRARRARKPPHDRFGPRVCSPAPAARLCSGMHFPPSTAFRCCPTVGQCVRSRRWA